MKRKLVLWIAFLAAAVPLALAQGRGGQGGKGQNSGYGQGQQRRSEGSESGAGNTDRQHDRVHASQQQQDQVKACDRAAVAVRDQARQMGKYGQNAGFNADKAHQDRDQLQERVRAMQQEHERLMQGLNQRQQQALESHVRNMTRLQEQLNARMQDLNAELDKANPDLKPVTTHAREVERVSEEWRNQYDSIRSRLTTEP
jgi:chromosome segregation ATPase